MSTNHTSRVTLPPNGTAPATMAGRVASAGRPLAEIALTLTDRSGTQVARATTGSDGRFVITAPAPGTYVLIAAGPGYRPHAATVVTDTSGVDQVSVAMQPVAYVDGTVHERHSGKPIPSATVTALGSNGEVLASAQSDADGHYNLAGVDSVQVTIVASAPYAEPAAAVVTLDGAGGQHATNLALDTHHTLTGTVTSGGRAVPDLRLALRDDRGDTVGTAATDHAGAYRFERVPAGRYTLHSAAAAPQSVPLPAATEETSVDFSL